jgi:histidine triad (HIT) family protein
MFVSDPIASEAIVDCIFCKIAAGSIPAKKVREDDAVLAFHDIDPKAPTHILVIPKKHIASLAEAKADDAALLGRLLLAVAEIAQEQGLGKGYRVVISTGAEGGQTVDHLHLHVLGGRQMHWPPG